MIFFSFSQDTKTESSLNTVKLSFLILLCITEDQYGNALMHDPNLVFRVRVHRAPMRHRKPSTQWLSEANSKCLASAVLDLMVRAYWYFKNETTNVRILLVSIVESKHCTYCLKYLKRFVFTALRLSLCALT